jgi:hypothetical protein
VFSEISQTFEDGAVWVDLVGLSDQAALIQEIVNEFLMSAGYLPGAHSADRPIYEVVLAERPPWHS